MAHEAISESAVYAPFLSGAAVLAGSLKGCMLKQHPSTSEPAVWQKVLAAPGDGSSHPRPLAPQVAALPGHHFERRRPGRAAATAGDAASQGSAAPWPA